MKTIKPGGVLDTIKKLAARPEGVTAAEVAEAAGVISSRASARLHKNVQRGHIFRSKRLGFVNHWFDSEERARAWAAMPPMHKPKLTAPVRKPIQKRPTLERNTGQAALTRYTAGASKLVSFAPDAPVSSAGAKYTICPSGLDHRFVALPEEAAPVFSSLGIGRYLEALA